MNPGASPGETLHGVMDVGAQSLPSPSSLLSSPFGAGERKNKQLMPKQSLLRERFPVDNQQESERDNEIFDSERS